MFWAQGLEKKLWCGFKVLTLLSLFTVLTQKLPVTSTTQIPSFVLFFPYNIYMKFFLDRTVCFPGWTPAPSAAKGELELTAMLHHC